MSQTPGKLIPGDGAVDNRAGKKNQGSPKALIQVVLPFSISALLDLELYMFVFSFYFLETCHQEGGQSQKCLPKARTRICTPRHQTHHDPQSPLCEWLSMFLQLFSPV